ncbi:hypothetical protein EMIT036CA2_60108 [Chryseobacterium sp. IT-36CA2]
MTDFHITYYQLIITHKICGNGGMVDTLDLGSSFWGFESLFPYQKYK